MTRHTQDTRGGTGPLPWALVALLSLTACAESAPEPDDPRAPRDLDGAEILEPEWETLDGGPPWRLTGEPDLVIGEVEGDEAYLLHQVGDVVRLDDGRILLVNNSVELRMYEADGTHAWSFGGRGDGPGEFRAISGVVVERDTLFVFDQHSARISFLDPTGSYLGDLPSPSEMAWIMGMVPRFTAALPDGRFVFHSAGFLAPRLESVQLHWQTAADLAMSRDGTAADTLGVVGMEWVTGNRHFLAPPFGRTVVSAVGAGVRLSAHSEWYEVEVRDLATGAVERLIRPRRSPEPLSTREFAAALDERFEAALTSQARGDIAGAEEALLPLREAAPRYRTRPAWTNLHLGEDWVVWAREFTEPGDTIQRFTVFDLGGSLLGRAEIPASFRVRQVGGDHLVGVVADELGVERVMVYPVSWPARSASIAGFSFRFRGT
jgi:hypothetical protein